MRNPVAARELAVATAFLLASFAPLAAQQRKPASARTGSWKVSVETKSEGRYDDNVFLLSQARKADLIQVDPSINSRFLDMKSTSDYIFTQSIDVTAESRRGERRPLAIHAGADYNVYTVNRARNYAKLALAIEQKTSKSGRARARVAFVPRYFQKNYLADATNLTGRGHPEERIYGPATYREWELLLDYGDRLLGGKRRHVFGWAGVGYLSRVYSDQFFGRNRRAPGALGGVDIQFSRRLQVDVDYLLAPVQSPRWPEVLLLDESDIGIDLNGDRDALDKNLRTVQIVNRSHTKQRVRISMKLAMARRVQLDAGVSRRNRRFSSQEPLDVNHRNRTDTLDTAAASFSLPIGKTLRVAAGVTYRLQNTTREDLANVDEIADYRRLVGTFGLRARF